MIRKQKTELAAPSRKVSAGNLHFPNDEQMAPLLSDVDVTNNQEAQTLLAPEDVEGGSLHYLNDEVETPEVPFESERITTEASTRLKATRKQSKVKADWESDDLEGAEDYEPGDVIELPHPSEDPDAVTPGDDPNMTYDRTETGGPFEASLAKLLKASLKKKKISAKRKVRAATDEGGAVGEACDEQNIAEIDNEVDPAEGYLPVKEERDFIIAGQEGYDPDSDKEEPGLIVEREAHEVDAFDFGAPSDTELEHGDNPQSVLEANDGEDDDWDPAPDEEDELDEPETFEEDEAEEGFPLEEDAEEDEEDEEPEEIEEVEGDAGDVMDVLDVDGTEDEADDIAFATIASASGKSAVLHVIRANRIIASMTRKMAIKAGVEDLYLDDTFAQAVEAEVSKHGLRAGLKGMGLELAKVKVSGSKAIEKRVKAKVNKLTAAVRAQAAKQAQVMDQSFALAAVGMNRNFFKGYRNELKAALIDAFEGMGVRGASRVVASVFASHGIAHAKSLVTLAQKLAAMPDENRDAFVEALDMTDDEADFDAPGDEEGNDDINEPGFENSSDEFNEELIDDIEAPETIEAALVRPAYSLKAAVDQSIARSNSRSALLNPMKTKLSARAQAILNGDVSFTY